MRAKVKIANWFAQNYRNILAKMRPPVRETFLLNHPQSLKLYEHRQKVFEMMKNVAVADNEFHALENRS